MKIVKVLALVLLAIYLFFSSCFALIEFVPTSFVAFLLGLSAFGSGILLLIASKECLHYDFK